MNAQQLKNAILQETIEGRLVPQDPNDEPASALLARIRKEKERLVKEGKLKKKDLEVKPISEDEIPFEIPESWEWVRLSSLSSAIHYGFTASAAPAGNAKLLRITDIQDDKVDWKSVPFCTTKEKDLISYQLKNRDILIARTGGTIGKTYIVRQLDEVAVFASYLIRVIPMEEVNEEFLKLFMMTPCYWKQLTDASSGTGQPNVNGQSLSNLILPIPPKEEQTRILSKYEELLPKVEEYGKAQDALNKLNEELPERLKKSILQEAIEGRLVPQDPNDEPASVLLDKIRQQKEQLVKKKIIKADKNESIIYRSEDGHWLEHFAYKERKDVCIDEEIPFEIPESWEWVRLGSLLQVVSDGTHKTPKYVPSGIPFLSVQNISSGHLTMDRIKFITKEEHHELIKRVKPTNGDILICRIGTLGKAIKINWDFEFSIFVSLGLLRPVEHRITDHIIFCINSPLGYKWIQDNKVGGGTHTYKINLGDMPNMLLPIPPLNEQHRIVEKLEQLLDGIDKLKK